MQFAGNYQPAPQNWTTIQPGYLEHFQRTTKHVTTAGGTQVVDFQQPQGSGLKGRISRSSSGLGGNSEARWSSFQLANEPLIAEYPAKTAYGVNSALKGWIYVSASHFGWISHAEGGRIVTTLIPFSNIVEVVPSTRVKAAKKQYTFQPLDATHAAGKANGFQVFTKDNLVYQFFALKKSEDFFNHLYGAMGTQRGTLSGAGYTSGFAQPFAQAALAPGQATLPGNTQQPVLVQQNLAGQTTYVQPIITQQPILTQQVLTQPALGGNVMTQQNMYSTGAVRYANDSKLAHETSGIAPGQIYQQ